MYVKLLLLDFDPLKMSHKYIDILYRIVLVNDHFL